MKDIKLNVENDLLIENGDFVVENSFEQEVSIIISLNKGELKIDGALGCDLLQKQNSTITANELIQRIKLNLRRDNKKVNKVLVENNQIIIK